ncbi:MAG: hypothetical protein HUK20_10755, partial [Fibrobacter sp.]|nr:hypothetical protein [Fibrobacter sp.]
MGIDKIREYPAQISSTFRRFPAAIAFFFLFAIFNLFHTWSSHHNWVNILDLFFKERVLTFSETYPLWAAFLCIALKLFQESGFKLSRKVLVGCHLLVLAAAATLPLVIPIIETGEYKYLPENVAHFMIAISAILVASTLLLPTLFSRKDFPLWRFAGNFIKSFLLSILVTGAFYLTICLLTFCLCRLFDVNLFMKYGWIYFTEICWFILMPILFLTNLPCVNHSEDVPCLGKFATNILHYLFIPALLIYTAILY